MGLSACTEKTGMSKIDEKNFNGGPMPADFQAKMQKAWQQKIAAQKTTNPPK
jgi:hypothetical protein